MANGKRALIVVCRMLQSFAPYTLVFGNPARLQGYVGRCARRLMDVHEQHGQRAGWRTSCKHVYDMP